MKKHFVPLVLVLVILAASLLGCDSSEGEEESLVGSYTATQVNGRPLPCHAYQVVFDDQAIDIEMREGTLIIRADMTFRLTNFFLSANGDFDNNEDGDYTVSGSTIRFFPSERDSYSGTVRGDIIEVTYPDPFFGQGSDYTVLFEKQ